MHWMQIIALRAKVSVQQMLIYRLSSLMFVVFGVLLIFSEYLAIDVYFTFGETIGYWSRSAFYVLFGSFNCMVYLYSFLFEIGHDDFAFKVKYGELDYDLIRPVDSMFLSSFTRLDYPSLINLIIPIFFIWKGIEGEGLTLSVGIVLGFVLAILLGTFVIYLINQILMILTFWLTDFSNAFQLINAVVRLGSKPLKLYPMILQVLFGFCVPIILAGNMPAEILLGSYSTGQVVALLVGALLLYFITRLFWAAGLKKYSSASS